jgi:hypothetical protein
MSATNHPDFGTGLRAALELRGNLDSPALPLATLTLLVRDVEQSAWRRLFAPKPQLVPRVAA